MFTKLAGVTFRPREAFKGMSKGEKLRLVPEPENVVDVNAVRVERLNGEHIGYIKAVGGLNREISAALKDGRGFKVWVSTLTGKWVPSEGRGSEPASTLYDGFGVNIELEGFEKDV